MRWLVFVLATCWAMAAAAQGPAPSGDACLTAAQAHWDGAMQHYRAHEVPQAIADVDPVVTACGDDPRAAVPRLLRADLALRSNEPQRALDMLESGPPQPNNGLVRWTRMTAHAQLHHDEQVNALAQSLVADSGAALERQGLRHVETFEASGYSIAGYEGQLNQGSFIRYAIFLIRPLAGGMPLSIAISRDAFDLPGPVSYFSDFYFCAGHATLEQFESARPPNYRRARAALDSWVAHQDGNAVSAFTESDGVCAFPSYITPGLD
jgi:hypothetical protein